jgi:hypothetical protein
VPKRYYFFVLILLCLTTHSFTKKQKNSFLISTRRRRVSKNELKENIGEKLKCALRHCCSLTNELGKIQQQIASFQRRLISSVERLVENKKSFRKAKRKDLSEAFETISKITSQLKIQEKQIICMVEKMNSNVCLKS